MLNIIIKPDSASDDYDFQIYKDAGVNTLEDIVSKRQKPIRSNLARTKDVNEGITGLDYFTEGTHVSEGVNPGYCKYMQVVKEEVYYLVLDNVYADGGGALIEFDYFSSKKIKGSVLDDEGKKLAAEVIWENATSGKELNKTRSDSITGDFEMDIVYNNNPNISYTLSVEADSHFFVEENFSLAEIIQMKPTPIELVLPLFDKGKRARLNSINFKGDRAILLKSAFPTLRRLVRLMRNNPNLNIHIEGHTNGCSKGEEFSQDLSNRRALRVRDFLIENKIAVSRMTIEGFDCQQMLFPTSHKDAALNRRVEIVVIDY
jgi:outer membrane protein OmpA-like peptidoglycan-associated protein